MREDEEIKGSPTEEKKENVLLNKEEQIQENVIIDVPLQNDNINYIGIGFIGISAIFLPLQ